MSVDSTFSSRCSEFSEAQEMVSLLALEQTLASLLVAAGVLGTMDLNDIMAITRDEVLGNTNCVSEMMGVSARVMDIRRDGGS